jgi:hypothetical protein
MSDSPVSPEDIRAAAETYQELGPEYHDAVVASFLAKVDREVAARVEARLAAPAPAAPKRRKRRWPQALTRRRVLRDAAAAGAGALAVAGAVVISGTHGAPVVHPSGHVFTHQSGVWREVIVGPNGQRHVIAVGVGVPVPVPPVPPAAPKG